MVAVRGPVCCTNGIRGAGDPDSGVLLLGIAPGGAETRIGMPMIGPSGLLTDALLKACGWDRSKTYVTNLCCREVRKPGPDDIMQCWPRLQAEVAAFRPALVVLLGSLVTEVFFPTRKAGQVRGIIDYYAPWQTHVMPTYHPAALLHAYSEGMARDLVRDLQKIPEFFAHPPNPEVAFKVLTGPQELQHVLDTWPTNARISLDLETPMKEEDDTASIDDKIVCFAISDGTTTWWGPGDFLAHVSWDRAAKLLRWGGHNFNFDAIALYQHLKRTRPGTAPVLLPNTWDTMYLSYCLDERGGVHKLKPNAREFEAAPFYEEYPAKPRAKWNEKLQDMGWAQQYNSRDAAYSARLADRFEPRVAQERLSPLYDMLLQAAGVYRQMQLHGVYLNKARFGELLREWVPLLEAKSTALTAQAIALGAPAGFEYGSPKQLGDFLFGTLRLPCVVRTDKGAPSTAAPVIETLEDTHGFIDALLDVRHLEKAINTYLVGVWECLKGDRLHPSPLIHGTVNGRLAYNNPAINTTPKSYNENPYLQRLRGMYTASDDDHVLIEMDYRQAEVHMARIYSDDPVMAADLLTGDFHRQSAAFIFKVDNPSLVSGAQRSDAKRITFGQFFLIGPDKYARQANREKRRDAERMGTEFANPVSRVEAARQINAWNVRYEGYGRYVQRMVKEAKDTGEIRMLSGRVRRFPLAQLDDSIAPQAANSPIQGTAHDCLMSSIIEMYPVLTSMSPPAYPLIDVHDAVLIEAHKSNALDVARHARDIMSKSRFPGVYGLPVEPKMGYSWLEMQDVELD